MTQPSPTGTSIHEARIDHPGPGISVSTEDAEAKLAAAHAQLAQIGSGERPTRRAPWRRPRRPNGKRYAHRAPAERDASYRAQASYYARTAGLR